MDTNVNFSAPLGVLAFLGTGFVILLVGVFLIYSLVARRFNWARLALLAVIVIAAFYVGLVLLFAFSSKERVLARGQEKHFCEIDCHLAYSIADVRQSKTLGNPPAQASAAGMFTTVTLKSRFDEKTIGSQRGNGQLTPNSRVVTVIDGQGRRYSPSEAGQRALAQSGLAGTPVNTALRPGESYVTTLAFDLPADAKNPTLLVNEGEWETRFIIGHENSPWHKTTRFQL
ncbi:MAG: hypothetical protein ABI596_11645 [Pyrinomonadaceae bacterium]